MQALYESKLTTLERLALFHCEAWWSENNIRLYTQFLSKQNNLEFLFIGEGWKLNSKAAKYILQTILKAPLINKLKVLNLKHLSWDDDENCKLMAEIIAEIIASAPALIDDNVKVQALEPPAPV